MAHIQWVFFKQSGPSTIKEALLSIRDPIHKIWSVTEVPNVGNDLRHANN